MFDFYVFLYCYATCLTDKINMIQEVTMILLKTLSTLIYILSCSQSCLNTKMLVNLNVTFEQGEYTGGQAKVWIYPSCLLYCLLLSSQPITAKQSMQMCSKGHLYRG